MSTSFRTERAFEHALGDPPAERGPAGDSQNAHFRRIIDIRLEHEYYNSAQASGHDFIIIPTADTQVLINDLGLLLKIHPDGLTLAVEQGKRRGLLDFIAQQRAKGDFWSRLAFTVSVKNSQFFNITHLPLNFDSQKQNIYITNQYLDADGSGERPRLALYSLPIRALRSTVDIPEGGGVCIRNEAGQVVFRSRQPTPAPRAPVDAYPAPASPASDAGADRRDTLCLSLSALPEDKYRLQILDAQGQLIEDRGWFLYTTAAQAPLVFLDLLFLPPDLTATENPDALGRPAGDERGCYPLQQVAAGGAGSEHSESVLQLGSARCHVVFPARRTRWVYFIIPPPSTQRLTDLRIEAVGDGATSAADPAIAFSPPREQRLPDGRLAYQLIAEQPLPLQQVCQVRLRLHGTVAGAAGSRVLLDRLPVASPRMVYSSPDPAMSGATGSGSSRRERSPAALAGKPPLLSWQVPRETYSHIHVYL